MEGSFRINFATPAAEPSSEAGASGSRKGKERERKGIIDLRLGSSSSTEKFGEKDRAGSSAPIRLDDEKSVPPATENGTDSAALRRRKGVSSDESNSDKEVGAADDAPPPAYADAVNEYLLDPIQQFSAFPPVTLRNAQREFRLALEQAMGVLAAQRDFESSCRLVDEVHGGKK